MTPPLCNLFLPPVARVRKASWNRSTGLEIGQDGRMEDDIVKEKGKG